MICAFRRLSLYSLLGFCTMLACPPAFARDHQASYACEKSGVTRSVEIVSGDGYACRVKYTKPSAVSFPWSARNDASYCKPRADKLVQNLISYGWQCDSAEDIKLNLQAQIERYGRYIKILNNVGKTCNFYPAEAQYGNLCGDGRPEAAIVYTCEVDTTQWDQHLAVFLEIEAEPLIMEVGSSGYRQVSAYYVDNQRLVMETEQMASADVSIKTLDTASDKSIQCLYSPTTGWELSEGK